MIANDFLNKGNDLYDKGYINESLSMYNQALAISPNNEKAAFNKGICLRDLGLNHQALDCYNKLLTINPNYAKAYKQKGCCLLDLGNIKEALDCFNKAISIDSTIEFYYYYKGCCLSELAQYKEAIESFDEAILLKKSFLEAYNRKANCHYILEQLDQALATYDQALKIEENPYLIFNQGNCYLNMNNKEKAMECYDKSINLKNDFGKAYNGKGLCYEDQGNFEEACNLYKIALKHLPNDPVILVNQGNCLLKQKKVKEALKCFNRAIKLNSNVSEAYYGKGLCLTSEEKYEESIEWFDKAIKLQSTNDEYYLNKGKSEYMLKKYQETILSMKEALKLNNNCKEAYEYEMKCYEETKQNEEAKKYQREMKESFKITKSIPIQKTFKRQKSEFEKETSVTKQPHRQDSEKLLPTSIKKREYIGSGTYGTVYFGLYKENQIANKKIKMNTKEAHNSLYEALIPELSILVKLNHPNIIPYIGIASMNNSINIIMSHCSGGNLDSLLNNKAITLSLQDKLTIIISISEGLKYLNNPEPILILGNLKPSNILFNALDSKPYNAKIGDYGIDNILFNHKYSSSQNYLVSYNLYSSPEIINGDKPTIESDIYSLGIIIWQVMTRKIPFYEKQFTNHLQIINYIINQNGRPNIENEEAFTNAPKEIRDIIKECIERDQCKRPSISHLNERFIKILSQLE